VNALKNPEVGKYLSKYFYSAYQRVGTFQIVGKAKQGGNVASYFCTADGRVLHAIAGPVDANTLLREAKWVVEMTAMAIKECNGEANQFEEIVRRAHAEFLKKTGRATNKTLVHALLAKRYLARIEEIYAGIFQGILREAISTRPVQVVQVQQLLVQLTANQRRTPNGNLLISQVRVRPNGTAQALKRNNIVQINTRVHCSRLRVGLAIGVDSSTKSEVDRQVPFSCFAGDECSAAASDLSASPHQFVHVRWGRRSEQN